MRILRGLASRQLACGCLAGVYERYDGEVVTIVDAHAAWCTDPTHVRGNTVPGTFEPALSTPSPKPRSR